MSINVEKSIEGLWVANQRSGYLASWFPILRKPYGNFIELKPGLNVVYGMNGSGKTQLLEAISSAAEFKLSTFEGFILYDPEVENDGRGPDKKLFDLSSQDVLDYFVNASEDFYTVDMMLGWQKGYRPESLTKENRIEINSIISEFIANRKCLLTRAMPEDKMLFDVHKRESMNPARTIDYVPILLPRDNAPITREHLERLSQSFLEFQETLEEQLKSMNEIDLQDEHIVEEAKTELFEVWLQNWSWSPLINLRNFGFLTDFNYELFDGQNNAEFAFLNSHQMPIFLPTIYSLNRNEYQEFKEEELKNDFAISLKRENDQIDEEVEDQFSITEAEIGFNSYSSKDPLGKKTLLDKYITELRKKLRFLPGLRQLTVNFEIYGDRNSIPLQISEKPWIRASSGSQAERRWLLLGKKAMRKSTSWLIIDEPESGMHRTAEAELANVLASPEWVTGNILVIATHSPEFLNLPNVNVIHMVKGSSHIMSKNTREKFMELGIRPSDLLAGIRTFLLVEGEHEKVIFETMFLDELERMKCRIIVARGAKNMKDIFESQFIFDFTDAVVISLLDNIDSKQVEDVWNESRNLVQSGKIIEAGQYVRQSLPGSKSGENVFLSQFLTLALANGQHERVEVCGLSKPDIVFYFEPGDFGLKKSWAELLELHKNDKQSFKGWATKKFNADFSVGSIEKAALNCNVLPDEFGGLMMKIADITKRIS
jgi:predicted ATPase